MAEGSGSQRYCGNCGTEIRSGTSFCVSCGKPMTGGAASPGSDNPVPPPSGPLKTLADTLREAMLGLTRRFSSATSSFGGGNTQGVSKRVTEWFRNLSLTPKLILVVLVLLLLFTVLSPLAFVVSVLLLVVSVTIVVMRVRGHGPVKGWGSIVVGSIASLVVFGAMSNLIYGIGSDPEQRLYGEWSGVADGETVSLTFISDGTVLVSDGSNTESGTYEVDMSEDPAHLDVAGDDGSERKTILELLDDNHMRFEFSASGMQRPTSFDEYSLVLTREEDSR